MSADVCFLGYHPFGSGLSAAKEILRDIHTVGNLLKSSTWLSPSLHTFLMIAHKFEILNQISVYKVTPTLQLSMNKTRYSLSLCQFLDGDQNKVISNPLKILPLVTFFWMLYTGHGMHATATLLALWHIDNLVMLMVQMPSVLSLVFLGHYLVKQVSELCSSVFFLSYLVKSGWLEKNFWLTMASSHLVHVSCKKEIFKILVCFVTFY